MTVPTSAPRHLADSWESSVLCIVAFLYLPVAVLAPLQMWALAVGGTCAVVILRVLRRRRPVDPSSPLAIIFVTLIAWGGVSWLWSIAPERTTYTGVRLVLVALCLLVLIDAALSLDAPARHRLSRWLVAGTVLGLLLTAAFILTNGAFASWIGISIREAHELERLNRTAGVIALFVWPVALVVAQILGRWAAAALIALAALALFSLAPSTPLMAFIAGAGAFAVAWVSPVIARRILVAAFLSSVIMVPFLEILVPPVNEFLIGHLDGPNSEVHRFLIWEFAADRIFDRPLFGWGLDTSRAVPGGGEQLFMFQFGDNPTTGQALPLHPHNALIQIWLELGLVGLVIVGMIFTLMLNSISYRSGNRAGPAAAMAAIAAGFAIAQLSYGIWQGWWMSTLGLFAIIVIASVAPGDTRSET